MKKLTSLLILAAIAATALCGCSAGTSNEQYLYDLGIDVAETMKKLVKSDDYAEVYGAPDYVRDFVDDKVDLSDYDKPDKVYAVSLADAEEFYESVIGGEPKWNDLDGVTREQLAARLAVDCGLTVISQMNAQQGTDALAAAAIYIAFVADEELKLDEPVTYVYVYESGTIVAVMFNEGGTAKGQLIFTNEPDDIDEVFEDSGCDVRKIDIK